MYFNILKYIFFKSVNKFVENMGLSLATFGESPVNFEIPDAISIFALS